MPQAKTKIGLFGIGLDLIGRNSKGCATGWSATKRKSVSKSKAVVLS